MTDIDLTAAKNAAREALETNTTWSPMHCVDVIVDAALPHILAQVEARVKPTREDVAMIIDSDAWTLSDDDYFAAYDDGMRGVGYCLSARSGRRKVSLMRADAVLALFNGKTEQEMRADMLDALIDGYFHGDANRFTLPDSVIQWLRSQPEYKARYARDEALEEVAREHEEKMDRLLEGEWQAGYVAGNNDQLNGTLCGRRRAANGGIARGGERS